MNMEKIKYSPKIKENLKNLTAIHMIDVNQFHKDY